MKPIRCDLPTDLKDLKIEIFSDLHLGSKKCDYNLIKERVERVRSDPNTYCIILGDLMNNSTKTSVGDVYEEALTPMQQIQLAIRTFEPIKDKILGICAGNHERRSYKTDGIDMCYFFASELGLADRYDYCSCLVFVRFGNRGSHYNNERMCYTLYMTHGDGQGGKTIGGKANGLQKRGSIIDTDVVVTGHTHAPLTFVETYYQVHYQTNSVQQKEQTFVNASSTLDYEEYAELYGMKPSSKKSPVILLECPKRNVRVLL